MSLGRQITRLEVYTYLVAKTDHLHRTESKQHLFNFVTEAPIMQLNRTELQQKFHVLGPFSVGRA